MEDIKNASFESKTKTKIPKGAEITREDISIRVKEIENGFIISKTYDIRYKHPNSDDTGYEYFTKEWYSKTNPLKINLPKETKSLADKLTE